MSPERLLSFTQIIAFVLEGKKLRAARRPKSTDYQRLEQQVCSTSEYKHWFHSASCLVVKSFALVCFRCEGIPRKPWSFFFFVDRLLCEEGWMNTFDLWCTACKLLCYVKWTYVYLLNANCTSMQNTLLPYCGSLSSAVEVKEAI